MKSICSASGVSALLGITEPAMFGVTLKLKYPFYAAIIGSAVGNAYCAATGVLAQVIRSSRTSGIPVHASKRLLKLRRSDCSYPMGVSAVLTAVLLEEV